MNTPDRMLFVNGSLGEWFLAIVRIGDYTGFEGKAESIRFEEAYLEQRTPGHGGFEGVGGQGEDDHQNEDGCARVPGREIRERKAPQSVAHKKAYESCQTS